MIKGLLKQFFIDQIKAVFQLDVPDDWVVVELPKFADQGDFASPFSFRLAKELKKKPQDIALLFSEAINQQKTFCQCQAVNGFVNVSLSDAFLWQRFLTVLSDKVTYPSLGRSLLLEYVSANPTGPLHIGHGRWAVLGSVLASLFRYTSQSFETEFYVNNAGNQMDLFYASVAAAKQGSAIPENGYHGSYIQDLAGLDDDPVESVMGQQMLILRRLGVNFDRWFLESSLHESSAIQDVLNVLEKKGLSYEKEGAVWFKSSEFGDDKDRVLVKKDGAFTYFLVDIAYHFHKMERGFSRLINIWGADHHGYVPRVRAVIEALSDADKPVQLQVVIGQLVSLFRDGEPVRMSKRTGEMITLEEVIDEIGVDATRYFLVHKSADSAIEFDLELAKKKSSENPVYYVQYAHARMTTLLAKLGYEDASVVNGDVQGDLEKAERHLVKLCLLLPDVIWDSTEQYSVYKVTQYAYDLAKAFHLFYEACPIKTAPEPVKLQRLQLVSQTRAVLKQVLTLLGISAPDRM